MTTDTLADHTETELVYVGHRELKGGGKTGEAWTTVPALDAWVFSQGEGQWLDSFENLQYGIFKAGRGEPMIGGIYSAKAIVDGKGQVVSLAMNRKFVRRYEGDIVTVLYARSRAIDTKIRADRQLAEAKSENLLVGEMTKLRAHYKRISPEARIAFEVMVLTALRKGV